MARRTPWRAPPPPPLDKYFWERRAAVVGLVGALWLLVIDVVVLGAVGAEIPHQLYTAGAFIITTLAALLAAAGVGAFANRRR